jgi:hypothetical protein
MASLYRRGSAFTPALGGWDSHPHGYSVVMVQMAFASISKPMILTFHQSFLIERIALLLLNYSKTHLQTAWRREGFNSVFFRGKGKGEREKEKPFPL